MLQMGGGSDLPCWVHTRLSGASRSFEPGWVIVLVATEKAFSTGAAVLSPVDGDFRTHAVVVPLRLAGQEPIVTAVLLKPADKNAAEATRQLLELMAGLVVMTEQHLARAGA